MKKLLTLCLLIAGIAGAESVILNTFNAGELSPHLDSRVDFAKYQSGLRTMENFMVLPYGGAIKRSGTQYIAETKSNGVARLAPFSVGVDQSYVMEMGDKYIRFYQNGVQLVDTSSVPVEVVTPYTSNDVFEVQLSQFADTVYMVHPDYPPQKLQRTSTTPTFTFEEVEWTWPPLIDENLTDVTLTPSATTGSVTITSSTNLFTTNYVGSAWVLKSARTGGNIEASPAGNSTSTPIRVEGQWNIKTSGTWTGTLKIQVSEDGQLTWGDFRSYISKADANYDRDGTETEAGVYYRIVYTGAAGLTYRFQNDEAYLSGWLTMTNYLSATQMQANVEIELGSTEPTKLWSEGAFNAARGYPKTVAFYENRLFFGGTPYLVNTIWASMSDDYQNFKTGIYDDSSLRLSINSDNVIEWLLGRNSMFIGTLGDEWILNGGDGATPITPTSVMAKRQTGFGSQTGVNSLLASDSLFYLQRGGRKLREFEYSLETDSYKSQDAMILAEHISKGKILQIAEQQQPEPIIWCIRGDGQLVGMTYSKAQNVYGWHRQITDGEFESIAVIPSAGEDRVYVIVNRENGRFVEWFTPVDWGDDDNAWFVDSGLDFDGGDAVDVSAVSVATNGNVTVTANNSWTNGYNVQFSGVSGMTKLENYTFSLTNCTSTNFTLLMATDDSYADGTAWSTYTGTGTVQRVQKVFTNMTHLAGQTVSVFADGGVQPQATVATNGVLTISDYKNRVIAGLPYSARLSPMYLDSVGPQGNSYGKTKQPYRVQFRVNDSGAFTYGSSTNKMYPVFVRLPNLTTGSPVSFYSGDTITKPITSEPSTSPEFWVISSEPLPLELLSMTIYLDIKEFP